jgi:hypothetical protein
MHGCNRPPPGGTQRGSRARAPAGTARPILLDGDDQNPAPILQTKADQLARRDAEVGSGVAEQEPDHPAVGEEEVRPGSEAPEEPVDAVAEVGHGLATGRPESIEGEEGVL